MLQLFLYTLTNTVVRIRWEISLRPPPNLLENCKAIRVLSYDVVLFRKDQMKNLILLYTQMFLEEEWTAEIPI